MADVCCPDDDEPKREVEAGKVKQSFSHGRSNTVVVEVKRRRVVTVRKPTPTKDSNHG